MDQRRMLSMCRLMAKTRRSAWTLNWYRELPARFNRPRQISGCSRIKDSTSYVEVRLAECYSVLDDAVRILGGVSIIDYGVLLASYNGLTDKVFSNALVDIAWASS